jgi:hypothetical protein
MMIEHETTLATRSSFFPGQRVADVENCAEARTDEEWKGIIG